jgi:hypothetical protein
MNSGNQVMFNGQSFSGAWLQQNAQLFLSDNLVQAVGVSFENTANFQQQPIQWYGQAKVLAAQLNSSHRLLDLSTFAQEAGWQITSKGKTLQITTPAAQIQGIRQARQPWGDRLVLDLSQAAPWQLQIQGQQALLKLEAKTPPNLRQAPPKNLLNQLKQRLAPRTFQIEAQATRTSLRLNLKPGQSAQVSTLGQPPRLIVDLRPDALISRSIQWAPGLHWRQQYVSLGLDQFPVTWLEVDLRQPQLKLRPLWSGRNTLIGTAPLSQFALSQGAIAAINGGFFNRNTQMPLGAIRREGQWISSPILNRGAIAWNDDGSLQFDRLKLKETLGIASSQRLRPEALNSGYVQQGWARYTSAWGSTYTALTDNERLFTVQGNQIKTQQVLPKANQSSLPLPQDGYVLTWRSPSPPSNLPLGTTLNLEQTLVPNVFEPYRQILGAGPLLLQNQQIVLNAAAEQFSSSFAQQKAVRSAIAQTERGILLIVTVHQRVNGPGPSLLETAQLLQRLGATHALNLDGGSSTSLYLGGRLLNPEGSRVARVHNGIGIFLSPSP